MQRLHRLSADLDRQVLSDRRTPSAAVEHLALLPALPQVRSVLEVRWVRLRSEEGARLVNQRQDSVRRQRRWEEEADLDPSVVHRLHQLQRVDQHSVPLDLELLQHLQRLGPLLSVAPQRSELLLHLAHQASAVLPLHLQQHRQPVQLSVDQLSVKLASVQLVLPLLLRLGTQEVVDLAHFQLPALSEPAEE